MSIDLTVRDGEDIALTVQGGAARRTEENIEDIVAALLSAGESVTLTYDDANDDLEVAVPEAGLSFYDGTNLTADVDNSAVTTDEAVTKVIHGGVVYANHPDFATVQDALDFANSEGYYEIVVEVGDYGPVDLYSGQKLRGLSAARRAGENAQFDGGTTDHAIDLSAGQCAVSGVEARTTAGAGNNFDAINGGEADDVLVESCYVSQPDRYGVYLNGNRGAVIGVSNVQSGNVDDADVLLDTSSFGCVVDGNTGVSVTDDGSGNVVGDNS